MAPKGRLRPSIQELAKSKGAYIIVSTRDSLSDSSLKNRLDAMRKCLSVNDLADKITIDFYDCRRLADWLEQHPAIINWFRNVLEKPITGWQPYAPWAYNEKDISAKFVVDNKATIYLPNSSTEADNLTAINSIRRELSQKKVIRIIGLSGVGKTRLIQALFDERVSAECRTLDPENVIYTDISDDPEPLPGAMVQKLLNEQSDCVVVVDNCGYEAHNKLTEKIAKHSNSIALVTVEYDIQDNIPENTICYRMEGASEEVIKVLLERRFEKLLPIDIDKIVEFSDGNSRVAFALASTAETSGELARLQDFELFTRLFQQKKGSK